MIGKFLTAMLMLQAVPDSGMWQTPSGAIEVTNGVWDLNTAIVPRLAAANDFTGLNSFAGVRLIPTSQAQPCATPDDVGRLWLDSTDPGNTVLRLCVMQQRRPVWR